MASNIYYRLPLQLSGIMAGKDAATCDIGASISKNIELIIMTRFGEHRSDPTFGCEIWDLDFELIVSQGLWEKKFCSSIIQSVSSHETRLINVDISVILSEVEKFNTIQRSSEVKKKVEIRLKAVVKKTGEPFNFTANLFLSPLSID